MISPCFRERSSVGQFLHSTSVIAVFTATRSQDQSTNPTQLSPSPDSVVALNPIEVRADSDRGFVATNSLAGGRLAGDLKDTPVAYTVLTRDFIDALDLTDLTAMTQWSTHTTVTP